MKIEDIKRDREAGTPGEWELIHDPDGFHEDGCGTHHVVPVGKDECESICCNTTYYPTEPTIEDMRRIARVPELEAAFLEAVDRIEDMLGGDDGQAWDEARKFLERFK